MKSGGDVDLKAFAELVRGMRLLQNRLHITQNRTPGWATLRTETERAELAVDERLRALGMDVPNSRRGR